MTEESGEEQPETERQRPPKTSEVCWTIKSPVMTLRRCQLAGGIERVEGDKFTYGNLIEVNTGNIEDIGFSRFDIVTNHMDEQGHFTNNVKGHPFLFDFQEKDPAEFLDKIGSLDLLDGEINLTLKLQRLEVDGHTQGYFIYPEPSGSDPIKGFYLNYDAINLEAMAPELKEALLKPEQTNEQAVALSLNTPAPSPN